MIIKGPRVIHKKVGPASFQISDCKFQISDIWKEVSPYAECAFRSGLKAESSRQFNRSLSNWVIKSLRKRISYSLLSDLIFKSKARRDVVYKKVGHSQLRLPAPAYRQAGVGRDC
jgi:hypothetical protein